LETERAGRHALIGIFRIDKRDPAPAYVQLERCVRMEVADGALKPGEALPSVRRVAEVLRVSPNTVGRAYARSWARGWHRCQGWRRFRDCAARATEPAGTAAHPSRTAADRRASGGGAEPGARIPGH